MEKGLGHLSFLSVLAHTGWGGVSYKLSVGGINVAMLVRWRVGGQINAGGSDCLFPLFTHCHFRTLPKDGGGGGGEGKAGTTISQLDKIFKIFFFLKKWDHLGGGGRGGGGEGGERRGGGGGVGGGGGRHSG